MSLDLTRQSGIISSEVVRMTTAHIVGAGAIGSHAAEVLAKMGFTTIKVSDFDTIEAHNLPNQGYSLEDLGSLKVVALAKKLTAATGAALEADVTSIGENHRFTHDIVISAVDSMKVRKQLWEAFKASRGPRLFIDGRMGARHGKVLVAERYDPASMERYEGTLHDDSEGYQAPCTEKATIFCAYGIAAVFGAVLCNHLAGDKVSPETDIDFMSLRMTRSV